MVRAWCGHDVVKHIAVRWSAMSYCKAVKRNVAAAGITKAANCNTFRHSFATHLAGTVQDIRTIKKLLRHKNVSNTMIYIQVLKPGPLGILNPTYNY